MILRLVRLLLQIRLRRLEWATSDPFDGRRSLQIDAIHAALEALR